jgi:hypothetical protein
VGEGDKNNCFLVFQHKNMAFLGKAWADSAAQKQQAYLDNIRITYTGINIVL